MFVQLIYLSVQYGICPQILAYVEFFTGCKPFLMSNLVSQL